MNEKSEGIGSVVVLEKGAEFPQWVAEYQRHATNSIVVAYAPGESPDEFASRVARRLAETSGELRVAIVACGTSADEEQLAMRERICLGLLGAMTNHGRGELLLAARVDTTDAAKTEIFELAGLLCEDLRHSRCVVRVRFSSGKPESGIMTKVSVPLSELDNTAYAAVVAAPRS